MSRAFIEINRDIWHQSGIEFTGTPSGERGVLIALAMLGAELRCTAGELAKELGLTTRRLAQILRKLERGGHIIIEGSGGTRTIRITSAFIRTDGEWIGPSVEFARDLGWAECKKGASLWRSGGIHTAVRRRIMARDGQVCRWCGTTSGPWHIDHVKAVALGGRDDDANLCVSCAGCNLKKGAKCIREWTNG